MKVTFLVDRFDDPTARHRVLDLLSGLKERGLEAEALEIPKERAGRSALWARLPSSHCVVLQRRLMNLLDLRRLRRAARLLAFDFDDALPFRDSSRGATPSRTRERRFRRIVSGADLVLAGNGELERLARDRGAGRVEVLPTGLAPDEYPYSEPRPLGEGPIRLGWIGSSSTLFYLEALAPALRQVMDGRREVEVRVLCDRPLEGLGDRSTFVPWSPGAEVPFLHELDLGLAPVTDDAWSRGKCGLRILKYFATGVPVVASAVGVQAEMVEEGVTGTLVREGDGEDWAERIRHLLDASHAERREGTIRARERLERRYAVSGIADRLADLLLELSRCST